MPTRRALRRDGDAALDAVRGVPSGPRMASIVGRMNLPRQWGQRPFAPLCSGLTLRRALQWGHESLNIRILPPSAAITVTVHGQRRSVKVPEFPGGRTMINCRRSGDVGPPSAAADHPRFSRDEASDDVG